MFFIQIIDCKEILPYNADYTPKDLVESTRCQQQYFSL